jgi:transposase
MQDRDLYARILGISDPWHVSDVQLDLRGEEVSVKVEPKLGASFNCPQCAKPCAGYDKRERRWRHLDTCQFKTILIAQVPRVSCAQHGVIQVHVPWAEPGSGFTALMEAVVINWLLAMASIKAVAEQMRLSWDEVSGVMERAVARGLLRRESLPVRRLGVDEVAFQKRHEYVTVINDLDRMQVLHVGDDRTRRSLDDFFRSRTPAELEALKAVAMDMWKPFIHSALDHVPHADQKVCFDKYHVASHIGAAVDRVRREEHRMLKAQGDDSLKRSRFLLLTSKDNLSDDAKDALNKIHATNRRVARAWSLKETARSIWLYLQRPSTVRAWLAWISKAMRSRLEPMKKVARMIREHLWGIVNATVRRTTNAGSESMNAKIRRIKLAACGFRNRERFKNAIYFHLGGLSLYPAGVSATHTTP